MHIWGLTRLGSDDLHKTSFWSSEYLPYAALFSSIHSPSCGLRRDQRYKMILFQTSLVVQWLRFLALDAGGVGSIIGQVTKIYLSCLKEGPKRKKKRIWKETNQCVHISGWRDYRYLNFFLWFLQWFTCCLVAYCLASVCVFFSFFFFLVADF